MSEHTHDHGHDHDHPHPNQPDIDSEPMGYYQLMGSALGELLIEKGVITADELRAAIENVDSRSPEGGAKVVAKAWTDPEYKARLLENGTAAVDELGIDMPATHLVVVENTDKVHNVIVCTLCSCYPRMLLGLPPDWYKAHAYRSRVVREPRAVLKEFGTEVADDVEIRVHDSTADMRYLVLPRRPDGTEGMSEGELVELVSRDCMIGVTLPRSS
ncbi:MAG: nitrile hydratase subunit alpha [Alphaproteobacteria bacterium]|nr:nitrile hydratase subunit alpha [Alphaproteobacteria bacterium]|tara:strand:+ start:319 stop:963 length:645 start_codon:yes stop_codon:yes gene_type:complete